ncbi:MAG: threonine synthase [Ferrovum sp.]|nr:threonine synthase [Ferrovum sp.]NDU87155.1 threonine synthase [Ferrovum sp.]
MAHYQGLIHRYRDRLPVSENTPIVSLNEGNTPLIELQRLPRQVGFDGRILVKFEGLNPTGSFKDRGMTMAVTKALEEGSRAIICASTGNTSAAAAAYAARAGMTSFVLIPEGKIALGKLAQAMMHGAVVIQIQGNFDDGMRLVQEISADMPVALVNSVNPYRLQGQKTVAFEVLEALGQAPDYHVLPVGNAGNISAHWMGYCEATGQQTAACGYCNGHCPYHAESLQGVKRPIMLGYQAAGSAPFLRGGPVSSPETVATAIRIGNPMSWSLAWAAVKESAGWFEECTDAEILAAQALLARTEGIFCEPSSATSLAGLIKDVARGKIKAGSTVVATLTGHGLKDPDTAIAQSQRPHIVAAEKGPIAELIGKFL